MKRTIATVLIVGLLIGCKGKQGAKGDSGPGQVITNIGLITSNDQVISVPSYTPSCQIAVSIGDGIHYTQVPFYMPTLGKNVTYAASISIVELFNAQDSTASNYKISTICEPGVFGLDRVRS